MHGYGHPMLRATRRLSLLNRLNRLNRWSVVAALLGCLALAGCAASSSAPSTATATATATLTSSPTATALPTTCAQVPGFAGANEIGLAHMQLPAGAIAAAPTASFGAPGQYAIASYSFCVPNNTSDLIVSTGKGPEPLTHLLSFYGWASWPQFPVNGDALLPCAGTCFAFNVDNSAKALFNAAPRFLSLEAVTPLAHGLVTFTLRLAQAANPACGSMFDSSDQAVYGHAPEYTLYYDQGAGIQWPPMTRLVGNSAPDVIGQDLCSAGTTATIKAFMDQQFSTAGYASVACANTTNGDCWESGATTVTMTFASATDWNLSVPRTQP